ncbi:uncharacterized protein LOC107360279 [Tetranychus urticae]|uniref:uncharacterized protein LOC107360279 n=1 Tax=Tetranychus urticae TaxID=32264 RepID=UPI00077BEE7B|nr:uncharacterized protein LOC107360279 [Tetranychus urticae]
MNTVNPLKRPLTVPSDPLKMLLCKNCRRDDVVLNLKTCGCLLCDSCDGDSQNICTSCRSKVDPKIKLSFTKNLKCKFYEINKCFNIAEYKCKCIQNFVCNSCLNCVHEKRIRECCVPEILRPKVISDHEPCGMCHEFIAEFKMVSEPFTKVCFNCRTNRNIICISCEKNADTESEWNQLYEDFGQSLQMASDKIKQLKESFESSSTVREQIKRCKDLISEFQKCWDEFTELYDRNVVTTKQQLGSFNKISNILKPDGRFKTIVDQLKNEKLTLHGEQGKDQIINFLNYYREKIRSCN